MRCWPGMACQGPGTAPAPVGFHRLHLFVAGVSIWMWANNRLRSQHFILLVVTCMAPHLAYSIVVGADGWHEDWRVAVGVVRAAYLIHQTVVSCSCDGCRTWALARCKV